LPQPPSRAPPQHTEFPSAEQLARRFALCDHSRGTAVAIRAARGAARRRACKRDAAAPHHRTARGGALSGRTQMSQLVAIVKSLRNEEGQDLLEYALLVALIALIAIGAVGAAGGAVNNIFTAIANALSGAA